MGAGAALSAAVRAAYWRVFAAAAGTLGRCVGVAPAPGAAPLPPSAPGRFALPVDAVVPASPGAGPAQLGLLASLANVLPGPAAQPAAFVADCDAVAGMGLFPTLAACLQWTVVMNKCGVAGLMAPGVPAAAAPAAPAGSKSKQGVSRVVRASASAERVRLLCVYVGAWGGGGWWLGGTRQGCNSPGTAHRPPAPYHPSFTLCALPCALACVVAVLCQERVGGVHGSRGGLRPRTCCPRGLCQLD
jgi:hypothetical protein